MINFTEALKLARNHISKKNNSYVIVYIERFSEGWYFCYQSRKYLDTGNFSEMLAGNAPVIVDKDTGATIDTVTAYPIEQYLEEYINEKKLKK
jgi:hypothetical protein